MSSPPTRWRQIPELGSLWGLRVLLLWLRVAGRGVTRHLLAGVSIYYLVLNANARRSS